MTIRVHNGDLPAQVDFGAAVAIDTETLGLDVRRDRLCVVQLSSGDGSVGLRNDSVRCRLRFLAH